MRLVSNLIIIFSLVLVSFSPLNAPFPVKAESTQPTITINTTKKYTPTPVHYTTAKRQSAEEKSEKTGHGKSHITALLLSFFLGATGAHRFYLGYISHGIAQAFTLPLLFAFLAISVNTFVISSTSYFLLLILAVMILSLCVW